MKRPASYDITETITGNEIEIKSCFKHWSTLSFAYCIHHFVNTKLSSLLPAWKRLQVTGNNIINNLVTRSLVYTWDKQDCSRSRGMNKITKKALCAF